jgi:hypothetical protein
MCLFMCAYLNSIPPLEVDVVLADLYMRIYMCICVLCVCVRVCVCLCVSVFAICYRVWVSFRHEEGLQGSFEGRPPQSL